MGMGGALQQGYNPYGMYDNQGGFTPSGQPSGFGRSPYSVQNIIQRDMMTSGYGMNPYSYSQPMGMQGKGGLSMGMTPNYATTSYMNPYSSPYSRPYFPQTTGSFFRNNAPAFGFYGQPETFGMPGQGFRDPYGGYGQQMPMFPYQQPQMNINPYAPQAGGKGGAGGGKGGGRIYNMYDGTRFGDEVPPSPYSEYASKAQAFAEAGNLKEQERARLEAERLAGRRPSEANTSFRRR